MVPARRTLRVTTFGTMQAGMGVVPSLETISQPTPCSATKALMTTDLAGHRLAFRRIPHPGVVLSVHWVSAAGPFHFSVFGESLFWHWRLACLSHCSGPGILTRKDAIHCVNLSGLVRHGACGAPAAPSYARRLC